jgi:hypothetical protein
VAGGTAAPLVVGVDALGLLAAAPLVAAGRVRIAPGGPRWLADYWLCAAPEGAEERRAGQPA